ncbi:hypothetical protein E4U28_001993 [Claviceps purpurea]|nr:hypothetical protein E4U28_001993 [Claviceps purpurea]
MTSSSDGRNGPDQQLLPPASGAVPAAVSVADAAPLTIPTSPPTAAPAPDALINHDLTSKDQTLNDEAKEDQITKDQTSNNQISSTVAPSIPASPAHATPADTTNEAAASSTDASAKPVAEPMQPSTPTRNTDDIDDPSRTQAHADTATLKTDTAGTAVENPAIHSPEDQPMPDAPPFDGNAIMSGLANMQSIQQMQNLQNMHHGQDVQNLNLQGQSQHSGPQPPHFPNIATTEQFPPTTPFTPSQLASLDQHAYMMMALVTMSGAQHAMSPPPTVTPSQVTLPNLLDEGMNGIALANPLRQANAEKGLESFARVEFADSVFQMTTYAVIIGRDQRALEQARRDEKREGDHKRRVEENANMGLPPPLPMRYDRSKFSKSYVSEEGGMLGPESDSEKSGRPTKRRKTSTNGSSQQDNEEPQDNVISNRQYVSHTPGAAVVDLTSLRPSPWHVPFIGIHSPGPNIASKTKAISREHLKIAYNQDEGVFEAIPLHKNGFFCEDVHYKSDKVVLKCGDRLQIKDVDFRFIINGVERGRTGAEEFLEEEAAKKRPSQGGKEMSFDFEGAHGNGHMQDTSDELSDIEVSPPELSDDEEADNEEEEEGEGAEENDRLDNGEVGDAQDADEAADGDDGAAIDDGDDSELKHSESILDPGTMLPQLPKKRGPGRPPKNGIMSKREQRLLKKQQQEMAKKTIPDLMPSIEPMIKRKVGRPRKHPVPEDGVDRPEKRKYKPRKPREDGGLGGAEGSDAERRAREKKEKKTRPKSPPLELKIEDYTEGQLQKPNKNYGVLIHETLTAAPEGLTLKQIYKRICQKYPWFYFHTGTKGWESSVRHNLIGNEAFRKDETTNLWSRVPGVELDAGKKRKPTSPDRNLAAQGYGPYSYPYNTAAAQHMQAGGYTPGQQQAIPGYPIPGYPSQPGRPMQPYAPVSTSPSAQTQAAQPGHPGQPDQPGQSGQTNPPRPPASHPPLPPPPIPPPPPPPLAVGQPPAPAQLPAGYGPPPAPARALIPQPGSYSSPYASRPPPPLPGVSIKADPGATQPGAQGMQSLRSIAHPGVPAGSVAGSGSAVPPQTPTGRSQPPATPPPPPPPPPPARPVIDPRLLAAIVGLKNGLVESLKKAHNPKSEAIVMSALNRCAGLKKEATENDKMEAICIKGIRSLIDGYNQNKSPTPGPASSSAAPAETPPLFEARVLTSLNGFKDVSIKALKGRLGEARAEAVTLSAIDRVLGFADASIVPQGPGGEGESGASSTAAPSSFEGVEQHLIKSIRQLLIGMNQKLRD